MSRNESKGQAVKEKRCLKCGKLFCTGLTRCPYCGGPLRDNTPENKKKMYLED